MTTTRPRSRDAGGYELRVAGHLDDRWSARLDGLALTRAADGTTLILAPEIDQAALHGLLDRIRDAGLRLLTVTALEPEDD